VSSTEPAAAAVVVRLRCYRAGWCGTGAAAQAAALTVGGRSLIDDHFPHARMQPFTSPALATRSPATSSADDWNHVPPPPPPPLLLLLLVLVLGLARRQASATDSKRLLCPPIVGNLHSPSPGHMPPDTCSPENCHHIHLPAPCT